MKSHKIFRHIIVLSLLIYAVILSFIYLHKIDPSPSILFKEHNSNTINGTNVIPGKKIIQEFKSSYDNLGIVAVRFQTYKRINNDTLIFRIREKDNSDWFYSAKYNTDQFQDRELFPFGFPPIANSKNKIYIFEIESSFGSAKEHVSIDYLKPVVITKYHYPVRQYGKNSSNLYSFIALKIGNLFINYSLLFPIFVFFTPLIYFFLHSKIIQKKKHSPYLLILIPLLVFAIQSLASFLPPPFWEITLLIFWCLYIFLNRLNYKINLVFATFFLFLTILHLISNNLEFAERSAYWLFIFLIVGYIHAVLESLFDIDTKQLHLDKSNWL